MTLTEHLYKPATKTEVGGFNKVAKSLDEIGATPDQVLEKIEIYKKKWKDITLTPYALEKNWSIETLNQGLINQVDPYFTQLQTHLEEMEKEVFTGRRLI